MRFKKAFLWLLVSSTFLSAQMTWLNNGQLKLGVNLSLGGAVTYLSELPADINMINSYDWGRQIQMSYYSDPIPYAPNGNQPKAEWAMLGWNPIQSGDCYGNRSTVLTYTNADSQIYVKCIPMHWPLNNVPGECTFEVWYKLNGKTITVRSRINNARPETTWFAAKEQEQPAIYTNGPWYKLVTYIGDAPFTNAPVTEVVKKDDGLGFPWRRFSSPEQWMALVNDNNHGLGVWSLGHVNMCGGFAGGDSRKGSGGATDVQTGYISPIGIDILDSKITYDYNYTIIIGDVNEIRQYAKTHAQYGEPFTWTFMSDRQHWTYTGSARDQGWPIYNQLDIRWTDSTATILSPKTFWNADSFSQLTISADFKSCTEPLKIRLYAFDSTDLKHWPQWGEGLRPPASHDIEYFLYPTGSGFKTYKLDLSYKTAYMNSFTRIEIKLPGTNGSISLSSIKLDKYVDSSKGVVNLSLIDSVISQNINTQATVRLLRAGTEVKQISCNNGVCKITADSGSNYIINVSAAGYSSKISIPLFLTGGQSSNLIVNLSRLPLSGIEISPDSVLMSAIETKQLKLFGVHTDNTKLPLIPNLKINWLSRSTNLINISSTGNISGTNQNGRTFIIATIDSFGLVDSIPVVVIDTFVNASFELPAISGYQYLPTGSGWIFSGGAGIQKNGSAFQSATAPHGVQTAFLQSIGQISQNVLFESGSYYIIFNASRRTSLGGQQTVNVRLDSTLLLGTFAPVTGDFIQCTTSIFNTVTATHFLTFAGTNGSGDNTAFIDNIRIVRVQSTGQENCNEEFVKTSISIAPNPFNPVTSIHFKLNEITGAEFSIYNANGTFIRKFLIPRGIRNGALVWDGRDSRGKCGSAGLYIGKLKTNGKAILLSRLLLLK